MIMNATGWNLLIDGHLIQASFFMYNTALVGWTVTILFFVYQFMLYMKARNLTLNFITGLMFVGLFVVNNTLIKISSIKIMFLLLVLEAAGILYYTFWK